MKRSLLLAVVVVCVLSSPLAARQWTSRAGGFTVEAELLDVKLGNAILKKTDGTEISVPLNKLSLGDVRYINEVLNSAESGITGTESKSSSAAAPPSQGESLPEAAKPAAVSVELLKKLQYDWKKDQTYVYRVRIIGERGNETENRTGEVTYKVKSTRLDEINLAMSSNMNQETIVKTRRYVLLPGRHAGFISNADGTKETTITIDPRGRLLESQGEAPLPYLLGDLAELVIEPLPQTEQATWTVTGDPGVAVVSLHYPFCRFSRPGFSEGVPAVEKTVYTILDGSDKLITIAKRYEMSSAATLDGKPRIEAVGNGKLKFDVERRVFAALDYDIRVTVRDSNKTEETPLRISYRLLSEEDIAEAAKEAQLAKEEAEKARLEKARPLTDKEIATALADLNSNDTELIVKSAKLLAGKMPQSANPDIAKALESIMLQSKDVRQRSEAAAALKNWSTPQSVPGLIKALTTDSWPPVKSSAIEALCKYAPKEAVKPVAQQLVEMQTRGKAAEFLKAVGADAEDCVLLYIENSDPWVRAEVCEILGVLGTEKSLPALQKAVSEDNWMVNRNARKALSAVKMREQISPAR